MLGDGGDELLFYGDGSRFAKASDAVTDGRPDPITPYCNRRTQSESQAQVQRLPLRRTIGWITPFRGCPAATRFWPTNKGAGGAPTARLQASPIARGTFASSQRKRMWEIWAVEDTAWPIGEMPCPSNTLPPARCAIRRSDDTRTCREGQGQFLACQATARTV